jgi:hypothetical protein
MLAAVQLVTGLLFAAAGGHAAVTAQDTSLWTRPAQAVGSRGQGRPGWTWISPQPPHRSPLAAAVPEVAKAPVLSALVPGLGQHTLGQDRKWGYWAVEAVGWFLYVDRRRAGGDLREEYKAFAWDQARIQSGARVDGEFAYYETLTKWDRSGAFDRDPAAAGVQPETDATAFNGSIWALATQIFLPGGSAVPETDPQYQRALQYYFDRAYGAEFLWDWGASGGTQGQYGSLITSSDDRFRQSTNVLGAIIANHIVSAIDAYLSVRGVATPTEVQFAPSFGPRGTAWSTWVHVPMPR